MAAELVASWWAWIFTATLQASVLLGATWAVDRLLRRFVWPQLLACLWWLALTRLVLPLDVSSPWSVTRNIGATALEAARKLRRKQMRWRPSRARGQSAQRSSCSRASCAAGGSRARYTSSSSRLRGAPHSQARDSAPARAAHLGSQHSPG